MAMSGHEQLSQKERVDKLEAAVMNLAAWQPVASDIISGNRDLIVQLGARIEFLETALSQLTLNLATGNTAAAAGPGAVREAEAGKEVAKGAAGAKKGGRTYVKIVKDGEEEDIAEVPTNSDGEWFINIFKILQKIFLHLTFARPAAAADGDCAVRRHERHQVPRVGVRGVARAAAGGGALPPARGRLGRADLHLHPAPAAEHRNSRNQDQLRGG